MVLFYFKATTGVVTMILRVVVTRLQNKPFICMMGHTHMYMYTPYSVPVLSIHERSITTPTFFTDILGTQIELKLVGGTNYSTS